MREVVDSLQELGSQRANVNILKVIDLISFYLFRHTFWNTISHDDVCWYVYSQLGIY